MEDSEEKININSEWRVILNHLVHHDQTKLYRICRKMIIHLNRKNIPEIGRLLHALNPSSNDNETDQSHGQNWPKPKGSPFVANELIDEIFSIAEIYLSDEEITKLVSQWLTQENLSFMSNFVEKPNIPLFEVVDALKRFIQIVGDRSQMNYFERIGIRVALILRFLSDNLSYINIAKHYLTIDEMEKIIQRVIGPKYGIGKLGGKSAGLVLARQIIMANRKNFSVLEKVKNPKSRFLTSDGVLEFLHYNALEEFVYTKYQSTDEIQQEYPFLEYIFKNSHFPPEAINAFSKILDDMEGKPIVVRSSSLLEDSFEASFSGKYRSLFLANAGTKEERLAAFINAIAEVYASAFAPDPIVYRKERGLLDFREEMAVLVQEVVGTRVGKYYLPSFAGVAFSYNEFRWSNRIKREDGVVRLVAGLGTRAVDRTMDDYPFLAAPGKPDLRVNSSFEETILYSQRFVDVINLETNLFETVEFNKLVRDCGGYFPGLENIVSFNRGGTLIEPLSKYVDFTKEDLVVTFNSLLRNTQFINQVKEILRLLSEAFQRPIDVEFASNGETLYLLQCRPQSRFGMERIVQIPKNVSSNSVVFTANHYVCNGLVENIEFVVYVDASAYASLKTSDEMRVVGKIVSKLNRALPRRKFILIGPGRWGSKGDIKLGVPVIYSDINNTAMLIEVAKESLGYAPELSFGTHFFQDLVEANIKYLPLYPDRDNTVFNDEFFNLTPNSLSSVLYGFEDYENIVKLISINSFREGHVLSVYMDGENNEALAFVHKPSASNKERRIVM
jgi:pyruvate,water dikinase